ncbi:hypothetical protein U1Q18_033219, partial [Sarracenia purpurea var. burkii]
HTQFCSVSSKLNSKKWRSIPQSQSQRTNQKQASHQGGDRSSSKWRNKFYESAASVVSSMTISVGRKNSENGGRLSSSSTSPNQAPTAYNSELEGYSDA